MSFTVISRPPNDAFTFKLFLKLVKEYNSISNCLYTWSTSFDKDIVLNNKTEFQNRSLIFQSINKDLVILGIKDHLSKNNFNPWIDQKPDLIEYLESMLDFYQDKKFILFTSLENLESYITSKNVLDIIPWGGDITNQKYEYTTFIEPVTDKNFDSKYNFINLNRNIRNHRIVALSAIYGLNLESQGLISCLFKNSLPTDINTLQWNLTPQHESILSQGIKKLQNLNFSIEEPNTEIYEGPNDNLNNFNKKLAKHYHNSFVEIISETSFTESSFLITEKTLNSIYGCNFPIFLCSQGSVNFLRNIGLDVFDDIVDHSYDNIIDPGQRIFQAIEKNKNLLLNSNIKNIWKLNKDRFIKNINFAKNDLYNFYEKRATEKFLICMEKYYD